MYLILQKLYTKNWTSQYFKSMHKVQRMDKRGYTEYILFIVHFLSEEHRRKMKFPFSKYFLVLKRNKFVMLHTWSNTFNKLAASKTIMCVCMCMHLHFHHRLHSNICALQSPIKKIEQNMQSIQQHRCTQSIDSCIDSLQCVHNHKQ